MMTTREDTLDAWNDYQDTVAHCTDTAQERASQKDHICASIIRWNNISTWLVGLAIFVVPPALLFAIGGISPLLNITGFAVIALCFFAVIRSYMKVKELHSSFAALTNPERLIARKHREFITTVADELRTQGYAILDLDPNAEIPYIVTDSGVATVVIADNAPEIRIGNQIIYPAYQDAPSPGS